MLTRVKSSRRVKAEEENGKVESRNGECLEVTTGRLLAANTVTIVQSITPDDNQDDVQFVDQLDIALLSALGQ